MRDENGDVMSSLVAFLIDSDEDSVAKAPISEIRAELTEAGFDVKSNVSTIRKKIGEYNGQQTLAAARQKLEEFRNFMHDQPGPQVTQTVNIRKIWNSFLDANPQFQMAFNRKDQDLSDSDIARLLHSLETLKKFNAKKDGE